MEPYVRGAPSEGRLSSKDHWEDVYLRHNAFRQSPNPPRELMTKFDPLIKRCANKTYHRFRAVWGHAGIGADDLANIGRVHLVTYLHKYVKPTEDENYKILPIYLRQRFEELAKQTNIKLNCTKTVSHTDPHFDPIDYVPAINEAVDQDYEPGEYRIECKGKTKILNVDNNGTTRLVVRIRRANDTERIGRILTDNATACIFQAIHNGVINITGPLHAEPSVQVGEPVNTRKILQKRLLAMPEAERKEVLTKLLNDSDSEIVAEAQYWLENLRPSGIRIVPKDTPEIKALVKLAVEECLAKLPAKMKCPRCKLDKDTSIDFGVRVPRKSKTDRRPAKAIPQSHCRGCRRLPPMPNEG